MIRVLSDYAHEDLWESMAILLEDRFGWELYRPIGMEWYDLDIWQFERQRLGDVVARQFLMPWGGDEAEEDKPWTMRWSHQHPERFYKMVTVEQARSLGIDLVISTIVDNEIGLHRFASEIGAHYGVQVGNQGAPNLWPLAEFGLLSITTPGFVPWKPHVTYHQEFSLDTYRAEWPPSDTDLVATRVQCYAGTEGYNRFRTLSQMLPGMRFRHYGHCEPKDDLWGGDAPTVRQIGDEMRSALIAWHDKRWSDGYGHVIHSWFAVGRPVIGSSRYYADKLAGPLFVDGVTSFDMDAYTDAELSVLIERMALNPDYHRKLSENAHARFREIVNFDAEADEIRALLDGILSDRVPA